MQLQPLIAKKVVCTCQIQTAVVFLFFFYVAVNIKLTSPPRLVNLAVGIGQWCLVRSLLCAFVRCLPSVLPPLIYLQCKSVLGSKAIDEWKWKANELWSVSAYLPSCAFKNALRVLLSRTQEKPPEPDSTIRQTLLTRVFVSLSNTDKVLYTIMFACVPLRVLFFFSFFLHNCVFTAASTCCTNQRTFFFFQIFAHSKWPIFSLTWAVSLEALKIMVYVDIINVWFVLAKVLWPSWSLLNLEHAI